MSRRHHLKGTCGCIRGVTGLCGATQRATTVGAFGFAGSCGLSCAAEERLLGGTDSQFYIAGRNTNLVKKGEEPKNFEALANAKWKDSLMGEPRDFQLLIGFAQRKYNSLDKAVDLFRRIAANQVQFHTRESP